MTVTTHTTKNNHFKRVLNFGDNDLTMNQRGKISATQRTRLEKERQGGIRAAWVYASLGLIFAGFVLFFLSLLDGAIMGRINFLLIGLLFGSLALVFSAIRIQSATHKDLALNRVEVTEGPIKRHTEQIDETTFYYITIHDKSYSMPQAAYDAFEDDGYYRFYHTVDAFTLMSVEQIDPPAA